MPRNPVVSAPSTSDSVASSFHAVPYSRPGTRTPRITQPPACSLDPSVITALYEMYEISGRPGRARTLAPARLTAPAVPVRNGHATESIGIARPGMDGPTL